MARQSLQRSQSFCTKSDLKHEPLVPFAHGICTLVHQPFIQRSWLSLYTSRVRSSLFTCEGEYENYLERAAIRRYNAHKRTTSAAFRRRHGSAFLAGVARRLKAASMDFEVIGGANMLHAGDGLWNVGQMDDIAQKTSSASEQPPDTTQSATWIQLEQPFQPSSAIPSRFPSLSSSIMPSRNISVVSRYRPEPAAHTSPTPSRFPSQASRLSFVSIASSHWPDRISRTRPSFTGSRWGQHMDSTTVSGFSVPPQFHSAQATDLHRSWEAYMRRDLLSSEESEREEATMNDDVVRQFRRQRIGRAAIPPAMLHAIRAERERNHQPVIHQSVFQTTDVLVIDRTGGIPVESGGEMMFEMPDTSPIQELSATGARTLTYAQPGPLPTMIEGSTGDEEQAETASEESQLRTTAIAPFRQCIHGVPTWDYCPYSQQVNCRYMSADPDTYIIHPSPMQQCKLRLGDLDGRVE